MEAARERPLVLCRYTGKRLYLRRWDGLGNDFGQYGGQAPETTLFPGPHHSRDGARIEKCRTRAAEGDSATGAFQTAGHRPGGRRSTALAERAAYTWQALAAALAELASGLAAGGATQGKQELEQGHAPTLERRVCRLRVFSAPD
jgi:hypothetical protein